MMGLESAGGEIIRELLARLLELGISRGPVDQQSSRRRQRVTPAEPAVEIVFLRDSAGGKVIAVGAGCPKPGSVNPELILRLSQQTLEGKGAARVDRADE